MKFKKNGNRRNYIIELGNNEHISYCNTTDNGPETAYYNGDFYIYEGDFRKELEKGQTSEEVKKIFFNIKANKSPYGKDF